MIFDQMIKYHFDVTHARVVFCIWAKAGSISSCMPSTGAFIPYQFFLMLPYIMSIVAMIVIAR